MIAIDYYSQLWPIIIGVVIVMSSALLVNTIEISAGAGGIVMGPAFVANSLFTRWRYMTTAFCIALSCSGHVDIMEIPSVIGRLVSSESLLIGEFRDIGRMNLKLHLRLLLLLLLFLLLVL